MATNKSFQYRDLWATDPSQKSSATYRMSKDAYDRYEKEYDSWKKTGSYSPGASSWFNQNDKKTWEAIRGAKASGGRSARIDNQYVAMDRDAYDKYEKEYASWKKTGAYSPDFQKWYVQDECDAFKALRSYDYEVKQGIRASDSVQKLLDGLDADVLSRVTENYLGAQDYNPLDPEDMARKEKGLPAKASDKYYDMNDELDRYLYQHGIPSNKGGYFAKQYNDVLDSVAKEAKKAQEAAEKEQAYQAQYDAFTGEYVKQKKANPDASDEEILFAMAQSGNYDDVFKNFSATEDDGTEFENWLSDFKQKDPNDFNYTDLQSLVMGDAGAPAGTSAQGAATAGAGAPKAATVGTAAPKAENGENAADEKRGGFVEWLRGITGNGARGGHGLLAGIDQEPAAAGEAQGASTGRVSNRRAAKATWADSILAGMDKETPYDPSTATHSDELQPRIDVLTDQLEQLTLATRRDEQAHPEESERGAAYNKYSAELAALTQQQTEMRIAEAETVYAEKYEGLLQNEDFKGNTHAIITKGLTAEQKKAVKADNERYMPGTLEILTKYDNIRWMTTDQHKIFRYLANTQGMDAAMEYYDVLKPVLNQKMHKWAAYDADRDNAPNSKGTAFARTVNTFTAVTIGQLYSAGEGLRAYASSALHELSGGRIGEELVANDPRLYHTAYKNAVISDTAQDIATNSELLSNVYSLGVSIAENAFRYVMFGGAGKVGALLSSTTMYGQVAASTLDEYMQNGASAKQALLMATFAASAEAIGEAVNFKQLKALGEAGGTAAGLLKAGKSVSYGKLIARYLAANGATEAGEEIVTEGISFLADWLVMQDMSKAENIYTDAIAAGKTNGGAIFEIVKQLGGDMFMAGVGGFLSGIVLGGGTTLLETSGPNRQGFVDNAVAEGNLINTMTELYQTEAKNGTVVNPAGRLVFLNDVETLGLEPRAAEELTELFDKFASSPTSLATPEGMQLTKAMQEAVRNAAAANEAITADSEARKIKAQARLTKLHDGMGAYQQAATAALNGGDYAAHAKALDQLRTAVQAYSQAVTETQAAEAAHKVKEEKRQTDAAKKVTEASEAIKAYAPTEQATQEQQLAAAIASDAPSAGAAAAMGVSYDEETKRALAEQTAAKAAPVQAKLDSVMDAIIRDGTGSLIGKTGAAKSTESIMSKMGRKDVDPGGLNDLARGCFFISGYENLAETVQSTLDMLRQNGVEIISVKDFFAKPNQWGYRGIHINAAIDGVGCEIQFSSEKVWFEVKEKSEKLYARWRDKESDLSSLSEEDSAAYYADRAKARTIWEKTANDYGFPDAVNLANSDSVTMRPSQSSSAVTGFDGFTQAPLRNSVTPEGNMRISLPSSSSDTSGTNLRSIGTPPHKNSIAQNGRGDNTVALSRAESAPQELDLTDALVNGVPEKGVAPGKASGTRRARQANSDYNAALASGDVKAAVRAAYEYASEIGFKISTEANGRRVLATDSRSGLSVALNWTHRGADGKALPLSNVLSRDYMQFLANVDAQFEQLYDAGKRAEAEALMDEFAALQGLTKGGTGDGRATHSYFFTPGAAQGNPFLFSMSDLHGEIQGDKAHMTRAFDYTQIMTDGSYSGNIIAPAIRAHMQAGAQETPALDLTDAMLNGVQKAAQESGRAPDIDLTDYAMNAANTRYRDGVNRADSARKLPRHVRQQLRILDALGKKYGTKIVIEDTIHRKGDDGRIYSSSANGYFNPKDGTIHLALDAEEGAYLFFAVHELTHKLQRDNPAAYRVLRDFITDKLNSDAVYNSLSYSGNTLNERVQSAMDSYAAMGKTITQEEALDEIIADAVPVLLADEETVKDLVRTDRTLAARIRDFFEDFYNSLLETTARLAYGEADKVEFQALANDREAVKSIADMFKAALEGADGNKPDSASAPKYSIVTLRDGKKFVYADRDVIKGNGRDRWTVQLLNFFDETVNRDGYLDVPTIDGETIRITTAAEGFKNTAGKVSSFDDAFLYDEYGNFLQDKGRIKAKGAAQLDELLSVAEDKKPGKPNDVDMKSGDHQDFSANGWRYKRAYFMDADGRYYELSLSVAYGSDGIIRAYNIGNMHERTRPDLNGSSLAGAPFGGSRSTDSIRAENGKSNPEAEEFSDSDVIFSIRGEKPPKNTVKGYKVFVAFENKPGELYPPMVANPNGEATPTGVWLNADIGAAAPDSKTGRKQVKAGGKGTQASGGSLAFRPGWHLGDIPMAKQFARLNPETGAKELFPANFVWAECDCAADVDYQDEAMENGYTANGKFQHSLAGLQRLPREADGTAGCYRYRTNPNPDTVPWIITGAMKVNRILDDSETDAILRESGIEPMKRQEGPIDLVKYGLEKGNVRYSIMSKGTRNGHAYTYSEEADESALHVDAKSALENAEELARVREENKRLSGMVDALQEQFKLTKGYRPDEKALSRVARSVLRKYGSGYQQDKLTADLRGLFDAIGNERTFDGDAAMAAATSIAKKVLNESSERDDTLFDATREGREYLRNGRFALSEMQKGWAARAYESYGAFRKRYFGKVRFADDATPIDNQWEEICAYTGLDPQTVEGDQPLALAEYLDSAYARPYVNPFGTMYDMEDAAYDLAAELFDDFFHVPQVQTFADKQRGKLNEANRKYRDEIASMRQAYEDKFNDAIALTKGMREIEARNLADEYKGKMADQRADLGEKYRDMVSRKNARIDAQAAAFAEWKKKDRAQRAEREKSQKHRANIEKNAKELRNWLLAPTKDKHVPAILASTVADLLENIDMEYKRPSARSVSWRESIRGVSDMFKKYKLSDQDATGGAFSGFYMSVPSGLIEALDDLAGSVNETHRFGDMSEEQLKTLDYIVAVVRGTVSNVNTLFANARFKDVSEIGEHTIRDAEGIAQKKGTGAILHVADQLLDTDMLDSFSFAHEIGEGAETIVDSLEKGAEKSYEKIRSGAEFFEKLKKGNGVSENEINAWTDSKNALEVEFGAHTARMTPAQIMSLYALSKRGQALQHILNGGIQIGTRNSNEQLQLTVYKVDQRDLQNAIDLLSDQQKAMIDGMQDFLSNDAAAWGNEVWMQLYMYEMFGEKNYWPIKSASVGTKTEDPDSERAINAMLNIGATKALDKKANNPLVIGDAFDTFTGHVAQMARLNGLAAPIEDALKWYNYVARDASGRREFNSSVKGAVERVMGKSGHSYFIQLIKDINGLSTGKTGTAIPNKLIANYKRAAVAAKLRVVIQQPTAIIRASAMLNPKFFVGKPVGTLKQNIAEMRDRCPLAWWKSQGNYEIGTGRSMRGIIVGSESKFDSVMNAAMSPAGFADDVAWGQLWAAVKRETLAYNKGMDQTSDAFYEKVADRFRDIVNKTQVVDSVLHRTQIMRSKDVLAQMSTAFMSEPSKTYNMFRNAIVDCRRHKPNARKKLARAAIALLMSMVANAAVKSVYDTLRDRKDADEFAELYVKKAKQNLLDEVNPLTSIPYIKDVWAIMSGSDVERMDMAAIADVVAAVDHLMKHISSDGDSRYTPYKLASDLAKSVGSLLGIPMAGLLGTAETIMNSVDPGHIRRYESLDKEERTFVKEHGLDYRTVSDMMDDYHGNAPIGLKATTILAADSNGDGKPDFSGEEVDLLAEMLGLKPDKNKSFVTWARDSAETYRKNNTSSSKYEENVTKMDEMEDFYLTAMGLN